MSAQALTAALREIGCRCEVEPRGKMAVLIVSESDAARLAEGELLNQVPAIARRHGFTHVAVEIDAEHAAVSRD